MTKVTKVSDQKVVNEVARQTLRLDDGRKVVMSFAPDGAEVVGVFRDDRRLVPSENEDAIDAAFEYARHPMRP